MGASWRRAGVWTILASAAVLMTAGGAGARSADTSQASVTDFRARSLSVGPSESVADVSQTLGSYWSPSLSNSGTETLHDAAMSLDTTSLAFNPPVSTPIDTTLGDVAPNNTVFLNDLSGHSGPDVTASPGFSASRSLSTTSIPAGGGTVDLSLSITPDDPNAPQGDLSIEVHADNFGDANASIVDGSVQFPTLANGEQIHNNTSNSTTVRWSIGNATVGTTYTLTLQIQVPNPLAAAVTYKPWSADGLTLYDSRPTVEGTSVSIADPVLGGTLGFSSSDTVDWHPVVVDDTRAYFDSVSPASWTFDVAPTSLTIAAGDDASVHVTSHVPPGTGPVYLYLASPSGGPAPDGIFQGCCGSITIDSGQDTDFPIHIDPSVAPGHYDLYLTSFSQNQPGMFAVPLSIDVTPALPELFATSIGYSNIVLPASPSSPTDAVGASDVNNATLSWYAEIDNVGTDPVPDVGIQATSTRTDFVPPITFPFGASTPSLAPATSLLLNNIGPFGGSTIPNQPVSAEYDLTRTVSPLAIPSGGGVQTITITVTLRDPSLAGESLYLDSETDSDIGGTAIDPGSVSWPSLTNGEFLTLEDVAAGNEYLDWGIADAALNVPYTLSYQVSVPNTGAAPLVYKPFVFVQAFSSVPVTTPAGSTVTLPLADLQGGFTFTAGIPVHWSAWMNVGTNTILGSLAASTQPVTRFGVRVTGPATAGAPAPVRIRALDANGRVVKGYAGPVNLSDLSGTAIFGSVAWSNGVGTTTVTVPDAFRSDKVLVSDASTGPQLANGTSGGFQVLGPLDHFKVTAGPATGTTATAVNVTVTAQDAVNHTVTGYTGGVLSDLQATAGTTFSPISWTDGVGTATATFTTGVKGDQIVVTDGAGTGTSGKFSRAGVLAKFALSISDNSPDVNETVTVRVTAQDVNGITIGDYAGGAALSDLQGALSWPALTFVNGVATAVVSFPSPLKGDKITVADGAISKTSGAINVTGATSSFTVKIAGAPVARPNALTVTVTAVDSAGNVTRGYTGPLTFSDTGGVVSPGVFDQSWLNGVGTAHITFTGAKTSDKIVVTDPALGVTVTGTQTFKVT